jgi:hypothetical protein
MSSWWIRETGIAMDNLCGVKLVDWRD